MGYLKAPKINTSARMTSAWASSELLYDTDQNAFYKGDGTTTGGVRLAEGDMASVLAVISALEARVSTLSATPPSVSVTSTKLSNAISNVKSVINIVSNNLSVVNAARVNSENVISNAVSVVSNALSVESQTRSAQVASVNNVVSNLQSVVGALGVNSVTSGEIVSIVSTINVSIAAVSNAISVVSNAVSVVSNALSVETAARVSAVNALSNQVSQALSLISAKNLSLIVSVGNSTSLEIQVSGVRTPHVQFDPAVSAPNVSVYSLTRDVDYGIINYQALSTLGFLIPQDDVWPVKNQSGSLIAKGKPVMAVGTVGGSGRITIDLMVADGSVSPIYLLGVTAADIANGDDGFVIRKGKIKKLNTNAWAPGTVLYCDPATPGGFTSTAPQAPNLKLPIAFVVNQDTTNGIIAVRSTDGARLRDDHDVQLTSVTDGQLLRYNLSAQRWENWTPTYATANDLSVVSAQAASAINVVSNALSIETASRTSADIAINAAISNLASAVNAISAQNSVTSAEVQAVLSNAISAVNVVSNALSTEIVDRVSAEAVINQNVSVLTQSLGATTSGLNVVSIALADEISVRAAADIALSNAISAVSAQAASAINVVSVAAANALSVANVVSNALSIVSVNAANALSVANAASNAVSVEIVNRTNADSALSSAITIVSNAASVALSVANAASNAASVVSNALSNEISNRISADNALSTAIANVSNAVSNALSAINVVSNAVSVVSVALANEISARAAADTNILSVISVLEARVSANSGTGGVASVTSNELSAKLDVSVFNQAGTSVKGLQSVINALSSRISALSGASPGAVSVTSVELQAVSAQAASAISVINAALTNVSAINVAGSAIGGLQSVINALSNRISVVSSTSGGGDLAVLATSTTDTGPVNTTSETALFSYSLPTNLAAGETLVLEIAGVTFNNSGNNNTFTIKVKIGTTDVITISNLQGSSAFNRHFVARVVINIESTSAQRVSYNGQTWPQSAGNFSPYGGYGGGFGTSSENTSGSSQTFQITCTNSVANANTYMYARMATLYRLAVP